MKNYLIRILFIFLLTNLLFAQVPNSSLENWTNGEPDDWTTNNIQGYLTPVTQSNISHSGSFSAKIEMMNSILGLLQPVINSGPIGVGIPISERYNTLYYYYKYSPTSSTVYLTTSVSMMKGGQFIGVGTSRTKITANNFTTMTTHITYFNSQIPDAAIIYITLIDSFFNSASVGTYALIDDVSFDQSTDVNEIKNSTDNFVLLQNYPNPFNPFTTIEYQIAESGNISLKIYDLLGREILTLINEYHNVGNYKLVFDGSNLQSGAYFCQLRAGKFTEMKKMILLK